MHEYTTPWFWDTPEGGGWKRYWRNVFISDSGNGWDRNFETHYLALAHEREAIMDGCPGLRDPTAAERRAWRKLNPPAEGQIADGDDE